VRWSGDRLRVNVALDRTCVLDGRALQLVPSAFEWEGPVAVIDFTETHTDRARASTPLTSTGGCEP
jgi:hypothetical protein